MMSMDTPRPEVVRIYGGTDEERERAAHFANGYSGIIFRGVEDLPRFREWFAKMKEKRAEARKENLRLPYSCITVSDTDHTFVNDEGFEELVNTHRAYDLSIYYLGHWSSRHSYLYACSHTIVTLMGELPPHSEVKYPIHFTCRYIYQQPYAERRWAKVVGGIEKIQRSWRKFRARKRCAVAGSLWKKNIPNEILDEIFSY